MSVQLAVKFHMRGETMKLVKQTLALAIAATWGTANAASVNVSQDVNLKGAMAGTYSYMTNDGGAATGHDTMKVTDFNVEVSSADIKGSGVGFVGSVGINEFLTLADTSPSAIGGTNVNFFYGYATYKPMESLSVDAGRLLTTIGYEAAASYLNGNITRGFLWNSEPIAYQGVRASYMMGDFKIAAEVNNDTSEGSAPGATNWVLNATGSAGGMDYGASYMDGKDSRNVVDAMVSTSMGGMDLAIDVNYFMIDKKPVGQKDDSALGVAIYVTPKMGSIDVPVRVEYMDDGDTGIYGVKRGSSLTVSPTMHYGDAGYVKAEVGYVQSDNKMYSDNKGKATDNQTIVSAQIGYMF